MSTITMQGVARLARVQRPVVSMWRSRTRASGDPFPAPVEEDGPVSHFDAAEVADWLVRTGRGNNPDAVLDVAAYSSPATQDASITSVSALLALRQLRGAPIGELGAAELQRLALEADPDDSMLRTEIAACVDDLPVLARHVDAVVDADYTAGAALTRLLGARGASDPALALTSQALDLIDAVAQSLIADVTASTGIASALLVPASGASPMVRRVIGSLDRDVDIEMHAAAPDHDLRMLRRVLAVAGQPANATVFAIDERPRTPAVHLVQLPAVGEVDAARSMTEIDDIALSMTDDQRALVVGPASLLVDPLDGEADRLRSNALRLSRVRAIVRLPRGCAPAAPRIHLALWVLGPSQTDRPVAERTVVTADLDHLELSADVRQDVVTDVVSSLGGAYERHLRAFRFAVPVVLRSLLALGRHLVPPRLRTEPFDTDAELVSRFLDAHGRVAGIAPPLPAVVPGDSAHDQLSPALLGDLVRDKQIRRIPGTRLPDEAFTTDRSSGFRVITAAAVRGETTESGYVDRLRFAQLGHSARLTEAGDVIIVGGDLPAALLDEFGASVVESPAAILRVDTASSVPIEPALLQHDIERFAAGEWRTWPVRRLAVSGHDALRESIDGVTQHIEALTDQIARLEQYERALVDGFVAGVLAPEGEHPRKDDRQGGH